MLAISRFPNNLKARLRRQDLLDHLQNRWMIVLDKNSKAAYRGGIFKAPHRVVWGRNIEASREGRDRVFVLSFSTQAALVCHVYKMSNRNVVPHFFAGSMSCSMTFRPPGRLCDFGHRFEPNRLRCTLEKPNPADELTHLLW